MQSLKPLELNCCVALEHLNQQQNTDRVGLSRPLAVRAPASTRGGALTGVKILKMSYHF